MKNRYAQLQSIFLGGEIGKRADMNLGRFAMQDFAPESERAFRSEEYEWPGDNEGRLLLAHALLEKATHRTSEYKKAVLDGILGRMNEKGYYGPVLGGGFISEQQAAGNSWILRGLLECYLLNKEERILEAVKQLVHTYLYSLLEEINDYPFGEKMADYAGKAEGCLIPEPFGKWYMSTDFGCLFILADGVSQAYEILKEERLGRLAEALIEKFAGIDIEKYHFQTHAVLSCTRGMLSYYEITGKEKYLKLAIKYFNLYKRKGMDACYANYNWFGCPGFTEPCAIIDSFLLALGLYRNTGEAGFLNTAHYIMYNGLMRGQRQNGGFGCDTCAGGEKAWTEIVEENYEAWWCCSKRGAEFFSVAASSLFLIEGSRIYLPVYEESCCRAEGIDSGVILKESTRFPEEGYVRLEVLEGKVQSTFTICFFIPEYVDHRSIRLLCGQKDKAYKIQDGFLLADWGPQDGCCMELYMELPFHMEAAVGAFSYSGDKVLMQGPMILGTAYDENRPQTAPKLENLITAGPGCCLDEETGSIYVPVKNTSYIEKNTALAGKTQVIFRDN